jgi:hypothetical protein
MDAGGRRALQSMTSGGRYETSYPASSPPEIGINLQSISAEIVVADSARPETPAADNTEMPLLDPKIGRGLFTAIVLNLVLDGLSLVE